jgi:hypothetical protein
MATSPALFTDELFGNIPRTSTTPNSGSIAPPGR